MKPILTIILLFLLKLLCAQSLPDTLSLEQLRDLAATQALSVQLAQRDAELSVLDQEILQAQLKPRLDFSANLPNYFSSFSETTQPDGTVAFRPININNSFAQLQLTQQVAATGGTVFVRSNLQRFDDFENDQQNYNGIPVRVGILQPILGFNAWKWRKRILPAYSSENEALYQAEAAQAAATATNLFFQLLFAQQEKEIALGNRDASQKLFDIANERFTLGKINRGDLVQIELELTAAGQDVLRAKRGVANASLEIFNMLGISASGQSLGAERPNSPPLLELDRNQLLERLRESRPEFKTNLRRKLEALRDLENTKKTYGPQLNLEASLGLVRSDPELAKIYAEPQSEQIVSLRLQLPILDWGERRKAIRRSEVELAFVETINERELLTLNSRAELLLQQYEAIGEELMLARRISELAKERFTISRESYLLGSIPLTQLTLAQQNRDQLARTYLNTLAAYWSVWADLKALLL